MPLSLVCHLPETFDTEAWGAYVHIHNRQVDISQ